MATINFKGKNSVWNHHLSVPYQILEKDKKLSVNGKNEDENLIIEADNLIALKSLLPKYQGKIKCIYIDPPYNTGNENWVFNDKSNSPLIKNWIGKTVGADDLTRHDKWLCMMTPRLKLLYELLDENGLIFISIDDNELHHLKMLMNEIFVENNFVENFIWNNTSTPPSLSKKSRKNVEYVLCYEKNSKLRDLKLYGRESGNSDAPLINKGNNLVNLTFKKGIINFRIPDGNYKKGTHKACVVLNDFIVKTGVNDTEVKLKGEFKWTQKNLDDEIKSGTTFLVKSDKFAIRYERKKDNNGYITPDKYIDEIYLNKKAGVGTNEEAKKELNKLFGDNIFDYPKPVSLIHFLIRTITNKNDVILDSFAGSGTTAQAVLELNKKDKGDRKFILVQLPEKIEKDKPAYKAGFRYIHEITRERVKRVIKRDKIDVGFSYMKLGSQIDADSILTGKLPTYREFAKYVYYLATGKTMDNEKSINEKDYFVGKINGETVYLIYEKDKEKLKNLAITLEWAEKINRKNSGKKIVYAPACFLDEEYLEKFNIDFVSIPYNLFEKK